jgi:hypothetical protein
VPTKMGEDACDGLNPCEMQLNTIVGTNTRHSSMGQPKSGDPIWKREVTGSTQVPTTRRSLVV